MTLLAVLGSNAIAVPLSPAFPSGELKYILEQSEALMLLSSARFTNKAQEVLKEEMESKPIAVSAEKIAEGRKAAYKVVLEDAGEETTEGGMMLYTSGTTNRPVGAAYIWPLAHF